MKKYGLLPHKKQRIYGLSPSSAQILGWEILKFNVQRVWNKSTGKDVKIGVLDTGCDISHPDLKENVICGYNAIEQNDNIFDDNGHGTHVSGTIAAKNNHTGMVGVAPDAKVVPIKILNKNGTGSDKHIADGILWAVENDCDILTMSLGSVFASKLIQKAIDYAVLKKCAVFAAAGNSGDDSDLMYPAKFGTTVAIGSVDRDLKRSKFSCAGDELDFLSPGEDILSCAPNGQYVLMSGTSMATPFAVGCAALLLSMIRSKYKDQKYRLGHAEYIDIFQKISVPLSQAEFQDKKYNGYGIIQPVSNLSRVL